MLVLLHQTSTIETDEMKIPLLINNSEATEKPTIPKGRNTTGRYTLLSGVSVRITGFELLPAVYQKTNKRRRNNNAQPTEIDKHLVQKEQ